jgi:TetR/AcrR family transcriptional regulator, regulator of autoinduction and epiphytic fitness
VPQVKARRKYDSRLRGRQAAQTRMRILEAAESLFAQRGYAATTISAIAQAADVAPDTVYATFASKAGVLHRLLDLRVGGDEAAVRLLDRPEPRAVLLEPDPVRLLARFAHGIAEILERAATVARILRSAAAVDPEPAALLGRMEDARLRNLKEVAEALAGRGALRQDLDVRHASAVIWTLASPDVYRLLRAERRWSRSEYTAWLADSLIRTLLEAPSGRGRTQTSASIDSA